MLLPMFINRNMLSFQAEVEGLKERHLVVYRDGDHDGSLVSLDENEKLDNAENVNILQNNGTYYTALCRKSLCPNMRCNMNAAFNSTLNYRDHIWCTRKESTKSIWTKSVPIQSKGIILYSVSLLKIEDVIMSYNVRFFFYFVIQYYASEPFMLVFPRFVTNGLMVTSVWLHRVDDAQ